MTNSEANWHQANIAPVEIVSDVHGNNTTAVSVSAALPAYRAAFWKGLNDDLHNRVIRLTTKDRYPSAESDRYKNTAARIVLKQQELAAGVSPSAVYQRDYRRKNKSKTTAKRKGEHHA